MASLPFRANLLKNKTKNFTFVNVFANENMADILVPSATRLSLATRMDGGYDICIEWENVDGKFKTENAEGKYLLSRW